MSGRKNKIALVTGGTGGMGTAICERLYKDRYTVVANYRSFTKAMKWRELAKQWRKDKLKMGLDVKIVQGDVSNYLSAAIMMKRIESDIGPIDVLVNNAGIASDAPLYKMAPEQWYDVINTNLNSVFICSRLVIEGMIERKWGRIISISSVNGQKGEFGLTNYSAAKAGMYGFTKALALEVAKKGITVNTVSPGYTATQMVLGIREDILRDRIISKIPIGRLGEPREVAAAVSYLASDDAAFITGANIAINGGHHMY